MAEPAGIKVDGARQLRRTLKAAGIGVQDLKAAHRAAAQVVVDESTPHAPRRTGALAASIRPGASQERAEIRAGKHKVPYAGPIHWGWAARGIRAQPWLWVGANKTRDEWTDVYWSHVLKTVDRIEGTHTP